MSEYSRSNLSEVPIDKIEETINFELRHKPNKRAYDYLIQFLEVSRQYAYATQDDSWGELEKHLTIIFRNYEQGRREITQLRQQLAELNTSIDDLVSDALVRSARVRELDPDYARVMWEVLGKNPKISEGRLK